MAEQLHIFVYGLLTFPEIVQAITGQQYQMLDAQLPEHRRFGLSQNPASAPIPVLLEQAGAIQSGKLLLNVDAAAVAKLDYFEDLDSGHYLKKTVRVEAAGQWHSAICYLAGPALAPYATGDWHAEQVTSEQKQYFIQSVIPAMLKTMPALETP